ncbi:hypothetical protein EVAR_49767_1 [Eumeta japonica]|uniref:Uncharacterized protein n=1 Tax=Eumeta variegata TaxID=151549 RepID=A0A4C1Y2D5_EUMVA|nr:hypothetical protein EVAR_49767_1 [Eumeta japonica]
MPSASRVSSIKSSEAHGSRERARVFQAKLDNTNWDFHTLYPDFAPFGLMLIPLSVPRKRLNAGRRFSALLAFYCTAALLRVIPDFLSARVCKSGGRLHILHSVLIPTSHPSHTETFEYCNASPPEAEVWSRPAGKVAVCRARCWAVVVPPSKKRACGGLTKVQRLLNLVDESVYFYNGSRLDVKRNADDANGAHQNDGVSTWGQSRQLVRGRLAHSFTPHTTHPTRVGCARRGRR